MIPENSPNSPSDSTVFTNASPGSPILPELLLNVEKKLADIKKQGTIEDDERLYRMITRTLDRLKSHKDFETIKITMQLDIARKYIKDFIELRKALQRKTKNCLSSQLAPTNKK